MVRHHPLDRCGRSSPGILHFWWEPRWHDRLPLVWDSIAVAQEISAPESHRCPHPLLNGSPAMSYRNHL